MSKCRIAELVIGLLCMAGFAGAATKNAMRITILDSQAKSVVLDDSGVPKNCDQLNYDAYCHSGRTEQITNTLVVQDGQGKQYRVACTIETKWSKCNLLAKGQSFDARKEKRGITIYYEDDEGKPRKQLYSFVAAEGNPAVTVAAANAPSSMPAPASAPKSVIEAPSDHLPETVKCSFDSTPTGAEVDLDGRYVGSTPSILGLTLGNHVVVISMPGFAQWKRDFSVASGSELTVNAVLQKK